MGLGIGSALIMAGDEVVVDADVESDGERMGSVADDGVGEIPILRSVDRIALAKGEIEVVIDMDYGWDLPAKAQQFQSKIADVIEGMTAFNVNKVNIEVREVV